MRLLLDTHALVWWLLDDPRLSRPAKTAISGFTQDVFVSPVSAFEIVTKVRIGKFEEALAIARDFSSMVQAEGFRKLPVEEAHALTAAKLVGDHRDPFDRILAGQSLVENLTLVTRDPAFAAFGVSTFW